MKLLIIVLFLATSIVSQQKSTDTFIVMTYNIHHAEGMDGEINLERIADLILNRKADLVALQEVDDSVERSFKINIPDSLARLTGMHYYFSKNIEYQGGEYGNAILSRYPIKEKNNHHYKMIREGEQRGLLQIVVDINGNKIGFMNTHIDFRGDDTERLMNVEEIKDIAAPLEFPVIICGDFNDIPLGRTHTNMLENFKDVWEELKSNEGFTYPADNPIKRIDYIFYANSDQNNYKLTPISADVINSDASDHLPVVAEFEMDIRE